MTRLKQTGRNLTQHKIYTNCSNGQFRTCSYITSKVWTFVLQTGWTKESPVKENHWYFVSAETINHISPHLPVLTLHNTPHYWQWSHIHQQSVNHKKRNNYTVVCKLKTCCILNIIIIPLCGNENTTENGVTGWWHSDCPPLTFWNTPP